MTTTTEIQATLDDASATLRETMRIAHITVTALRTIRDDIPDAPLSVRKVAAEALARVAGGTR